MFQAHFMPYEHARETLHLQDTLETICSTFVIEVSKINREVQLHETVN